MFWGDDNISGHGSAGDGRGLKVRREGKPRRTKAGQKRGGGGGNRRLRHASGHEPHPGLPLRTWICGFVGPGVGWQGDP